MNSIKIVSFGYYIPSHTVQFDGETRYRATTETQLEMAVMACQRALEKNAIDIASIDLIVSASAVGVQPIPCTAALIHEQIAKGLGIPAFDINSTCTSFVTALDTVSYLIQANRYRRVLIVSSEIGSQGLNPNQKESYELFSDGAAAFIIERSDNVAQGVRYALQETWSKGAHSTEIRGGLTAFHPKHYSEATKEEYMFDMKGKQILAVSLKHLPKMFTRFLDESGMTIEDIDMLIPHQASRALPLAMSRLGISDKQYVNIVPQYGNMVSVSIPFTLIYALENELVKEGDTVLLIGTAAGLTMNMLLWTL